MATLTTSLMLMRWGLVSAVMMFIASTLKVKCRHNGMAFLFSGVGIGMSCWFVTGLLGITLSMENLLNFWQATREVLVDIMKHTPTDYPMP